MSVSDAAARVAALQALVDRAQSLGAPQPVSGEGFGDVLAQASSSQPAAVQASASAPGATGLTPGGAVPYATQIEAAASRHGIDPALLAGLIRQESNFDPQASSPAGAQGLTQLMPGTAASLGVTNPFDPAQAIEGGASYLANQLQRFGGRSDLALAAYNAGPGAVERSGGIPPYPETQAYVQRVLAYAQQYRALNGAASPIPDQAM